MCSLLLLIRVLNVRSLDTNKNVWTQTQLTVIVHNLGRPTVADTEKEITPKVVSLFELLRHGHLGIDVACAMRKGD